MSLDRTPAHLPDYVPAEWVDAELVDEPDVIPLHDLRPLEPAPVPARTAPLRGAAVPWPTPRTAPVRAVLVPTLHGLVIGAGAGLRWLSNDEGRQARRLIAGDLRTVSRYGTLHAEHRKVITSRLRFVAGTAVVAALAVCVAAEVFGGLVVDALLAATAVAGLYAAWRAGYGRLVARHLDTQPVVVDTEETGDLSAAVVIDALERVGVRPGSTLASPFAHDGRGWRTEVNLPGAATAASVVGKRDSLAAALRRPAACVLLDTVPDAHPGRLSVRVLDRALTMRDVPAWPWLHRTDPASVFRGIPLGVSMAGDPVDVALGDVSGVVGGQPRVGKSSGLTTLLCGVVQDPRARLFIVDAKGSGDFVAFEPVAERVVISDQRASVRLFEELRDEVDDRYAELRSRRLAKVDDNLASEARFGPIVLVIDEAQRVLGNDKRAGELVEDLGRRGPAAAVTVILATQYVSDAAIPRGVSTSASLRVAFGLGDHTAVDLVMGTGAHKAGRTTVTYRRPADVGRCWVDGAGGDPVECRTYPPLTADELAAVVRRAMTARHAGGYLTAAREHTAADDLVGRLLAAWPDGVARLQWEQLADLVGEPVALVRDEVRGLGVTPVQVRHGETNRRGVALDDVLAATRHRR